MAFGSTVFEIEFEVEGFCKASSEFYLFFSRALNSPINVKYRG
jgi:hypothetical protein